MSRIAALAVLLVIALTNPATGGGGDWPDWLVACPDAGPGALCGSYNVFEDRVARNGRKIPIRVLVLPSTGSSADRLPDPIFYFQGGPGGAATEAAGGISGLFEPLRQRRDLVFIDQRGTGSSNPMDCRPPGADAPLQAHFEDMLTAEDVAACKSWLDPHQADIELYTTPIAMDDIDEVRRALGFEKINLYGGSYGSRAALVYLRRHPATVRTMTLKGVAPMDMGNPLPFARALDRGIDATIDACLAQASCAKRYPDLAADWEKAKARFASGAVEATVRHPRTRKTETVEISRGVFADGLRHLLYRVQSAAQLPRLLHAAARGDFDDFAQMELRQRFGYNQMLSMGMFLTVTCSEDLAFVTEEQIRVETSGTFLGDYRVRQQLEACAIWGRGQGVNDDYQDPVVSDVPTLLISGEHDTATPAAGGESVSQSLSNSHHVVVPNQSHGFANFACDRQVLADFIGTGSTDGLDTSCFEGTQRPPFDL